MKRLSIVIALSCGLLALKAEESETGKFRTWTSSVGTSIDAELVSHGGGDVELKSKDGRVIKLKTTQLSDEDNAYLKSLSEEESDAEEEAEEAEELKQTSNKKKLKNQPVTPQWENFNEKWPTSVKVSSDYEVVEAQQEDPDSTHQFVYHSNNFAFYSDAKLSTNLITKFGRYFEATHAYMAEIPLSMARTQEEERHKIYLFESTDNYHKHGGPIGSAGVFMSGKDGGRILVPFSSVGVKKVGQRYSYDYDSSNKTLAHEIVHILTDRKNYAVGLRGWFTEGLAEYVSATPYTSGGTYKLASADNALKEYATAFSKAGPGRNIGSEVNVGPLKDFMMMPYGEFTANGNFNYAVGALITTYFIDLKRKTELENVQKMLKASEEGKEGEELLKILLNGRTFKELEKDIRNGWRTKGVILNFS